MKPTHKPQYFLKYPKLFPAQKGVTVVEYGLILGLVSLIAIITVSTMGGQISETFTDANDGILNAELASSGIPVAQTPTEPETPVTPQGPVYGHNTEEGEWLRGTSASETLTLTSAYIGVIGYEGDDVIQGTTGAHIYIAGPGDDTIDIGYGADTIVYLKGEGNDTIKSTNHEKLAQLEFPDLNQSDVDFNHTGDFNLKMTMPDGALMTIEAQFATNGRNGVKTIKFANGDILTEQLIRDKMIEDSKKRGTVYTTARGDNVYHNSAVDGNYNIIVNGASTLPVLHLVDALEEDFTVYNDALSKGTFKIKGDIVTATAEFSRISDGGFSKIMLSDGTQLTQYVFGNTLVGKNATLAKMINDMKPTGTVLGNATIAQTYVHNLGVDGSYLVNDRENPGKNTLVLPGVFNADFKVTKNSGYNGYFNLPGGEIITAKDLFYSTGGYAFSSVILEDATLNLNALAQKVADNARNGGTIYGTNQDKTYTHYKSDPQVQIIEDTQNYFGGTLFFPDLNPDEVIFNNTLNTTNTTIYATDENGRHGVSMVYLPGQTSTNGGIDFVKFQDGTILNRTQIKARVIEDRQPETAG